MCLEISIEFPSFRWIAGCDCSVCGTMQTRLIRRIGNRARFTSAWFGPLISDWSKLIVLENEHLSLAFDLHTGALVKLATRLRVGNADGSPSWRIVYSLRSDGRSILQSGARARNTLMSWRKSPTNDAGSCLVKFAERVPGRAGHNVARTCTWT